jgi:hypothetical protein
MYGKSPVTRLADKTPRVVGHDAFSMSMSGIIAKDVS